jgi:MATE family multidrug resistance protein
MITIPSKSTVNHRQVLAIAVPIMLSNVTEPLIGVVDTAVVGQIPDAALIGAIALGALIFSLIYSAFGFLRLGTGGMTAQATGAGDRQELAAIFFRALIIAFACGLAVIALSPFIRTFAFAILEGSPDVERHARQYFAIRVFSVPFGLANYCLLGWFIGQGKAKTAFIIQLFLNVANMALDAMFVLGFGMTSDGVAYGTLIAETAAALLGLEIARRYFRRAGLGFDTARIFERAKLKRTLAINRDIMVRSLSLVFAFSWFTARSARLGDVPLAANAILMHFFEVAAFLIDGFASASETLVGQAIGARDRPRFDAAVRLTSIWAGVVGVSCMAVIVFLGPLLIDLMTVTPEIRAYARAFLVVAAVTPLVGTVCFQYDGIFIGATQTADMRNMMLVSLAVFLAASTLLEPRYGNQGLWIAMIVFFVTRGVTFGFRMPALKRRAFT